MTTINTTLTTSGNSSAVRLPKELLRMGGLGNKVRLEAKKGKIIISKSENPREKWGEQIKSLLATAGDPSKEFVDMDIIGADGLANAPWNGPTFEQWQKSRAKLS